MSELLVEGGINIIGCEQSFSSPMRKIGRLLAVTVNASKYKIKTVRAEHKDVFV